MQAIISFFESIGSIISTVIDFIIGLFRDLIFLIQLLGNFLANIPTYLSFLPSAVTASVILIFSIAVIFKILGREG